jgi:superfamily I DNA/RNA helicase
MSLSQGSFERMRVTTVFASPGAGKTTEIKRRFLEATGERKLAVDQVLVLAASREAANSLRDELALSLQRPRVHWLGRSPLLPLPLFEPRPSLTELRCPS